MQFKDLTAALHTHTTNSFLDATSDVEDYLKECQSRNIKYLSITDHGQISSLYKLLNLAPKYNITALPGIEAYCDMSEQYPEAKMGMYGHITLHAKNDIGVQNLLILFNKSWDKMSKARFGLKKPMITWDLLEEYNEGIFAGCGCLVGLMARNIIKNKPELAEQNLDHLIAIFGKNRLYAEFMPSIADRDWNVKTREFQKNPCTADCPDGDLNKKYQTWLFQEAVIKRKLKPVITLDSHFVKPEEKKIQDIVLSSNESGWHFAESFYMLEPEKVYNRLLYLPNFNQSMHEQMIDNAEFFCQDVNISPQPKKLYLPYKNDNKVDSYVQFYENINQKHLGKILDSKNR